MLYRCLCKQFDPHCATGLYLLLVEGVVRCIVYSVLDCRIRLQFEIIFCLSV